MINNESTVFNQKALEAVEWLYDAKYICDSCLQDIYGNWLNIPVAFFYTKKKHPEGSNYFGLYKGVDGLRIIDGIKILDQKITGVKADDGEIIYSRYRHDYRESKDGTAMVDGGRDYLRSSLSPLVELYVDKDKLKEVYSG